MITEAEARAEFRARTKELPDVHYDECAFEFTITSPIDGEKFYAATIGDCESLYARHRAAFAKQARRDPIGFTVAMECAMRDDNVSRAALGIERCE